MLEGYVEWYVKDLESTVGVVDTTTITISDRDGKFPIIVRELKDGSMTANYRGGWYHSSTKLSSDVVKEVLVEEFNQNPNRFHD